MNLSIDQLPSEVMRNIAHHLTSLDALRLSRASKNLHSQLSLATTRPRKVLTGFSRDNCDDDMHYGFEVPKLSDVSSVHTLNITMNWRDQGWGNRKGRLMLVAENENESYDRSGSNNGQKFARVIYKSRIAKHSRRRLRITFSPKQNETYHLWYLVGGGGGHLLELRNVEVQALVFDDCKTVAKSSNFLAESNLLLPWDETAKLSRDPLITAVISSTACLLREGRPVLPPLISYFESYGISESDLSLKLIESIESSLEDWAQHGCIYQERWLSSFEPEDISIYSENDDEDGEEGVEMGAPHGYPYDNSHANIRQYAQRLYQDRPTRRRGIQRFFSSAFRRGPEV